MSTIDHIDDYHVKLIANFATVKSMLLKACGISEDEYQKLKEDKAAAAERMKDEKFKSNFIALRAFDKAFRIVDETFDEYLPF